MRCGHRWPPSHRRLKEWMQSLSPDFRPVQRSYTSRPSFGRPGRHLHVARFRGGGLVALLLYQGPGLRGGGGRTPVPVRLPELKSIQAQSESSRRLLAGSLPARAMVMMIIPS
ncbi:hypothetical protein GQ53DRAFT_243087 [Thozetella sp. PMI_491]|nr:hypothetical protein GQ53DRAFT_243087 [Thozetella sp. PMI_491]